MFQHAASPVRAREAVHADCDATAAANIEASAVMGTLMEKIQMGPALGTSACCVMEHMHQSAAFRGLRGRHKELHGAQAMQVH